MNTVAPVKPLSGTTWKKFVCALSLVAAAPLASAAYSNAVSIVKFEAIDAGGMGPRQFLIFNASPHSTACAHNATGYWRIGGAPEHQKTVLALAMAARLSERPVKVFFDTSYSGTSSCDGGGTAGYPVLLGIEVL